MDDLISRKAAIELVKDVCDAIMSGCESRYDPETEDEVYTDIREVDAILKCNKEVRIALRNMPSAQPDMSEYSDKLWKAAYERGKAEAQPDLDEVYAHAETEAEARFHAEIVRCKDCKHQVKEWRDDKRLKDKGYWVCGCEVVGDACGYWALLGQDDDYCSMAERRLDVDANT